MQYIWHRQSKTPTGSYMRIYIKLSTHYIDYLHIVTQLYWKQWH